MLEVDPELNPLDSLLATDDCIAVMAPDMVLRAGLGVGIGLGIGWEDISGIFVLVEVTLIMLVTFFNGTLSFGLFFEVSIFSVNPPVCKNLFLNAASI